MTDVRGKVLITYFTAIPGKATVNYLVDVYARDTPPLYARDTPPLMTASAANSAE